MGIIVMIMLLATGVGMAWAFDVFVLRRNRPSVKVEGYTLVQALRKSETYANLRSGKEVSRLRPGDRDSHHDSHMGDPRDGGDGGEVLQLDRRRKV